VPGEGSLHPWVRAWEGSPSFTQKLYKQLLAAGGEGGVKQLSFWGNALKKQEML